jgi:hypothetical protein
LREQFAFRRGGVGWSERKRQCEHSARGGITPLDHEVAAMSGGHLTTDEEPKAGPGYIAEARMLAAVKSLEHRFPLALRDSNAVVGHAQDALSVLDGDADRDPRWAQRIGQAIVDQVVEQPTELHRIAGHQGRLVGDLKVNLGIQ